MSDERSSVDGLRLGCVALVDDNPADNYIHRLVIERSGLADRVVDFTDPREALEALLGNRLPDGTIVFLDIRMPHLDGFQFLSEFERRGKHRSDVVIVMLTTSLLPEDQDRAKSTGVAKDFIQKPLTHEMLVEIVETYGKP